MIRVVRPFPEPEELGDARRDQFWGVRAKWVRNEVIQASDFKDYGVVKPKLAALLADKCWYCEKRVEAKYEGVDHGRPKTRADRGEAHPTYGYWWLAWTWENLLFACDDCNKAKGTRFPLTKESIPLNPAIEEIPPGREVALLLDPTIDDPLDHIEFKFEKSTSEQDGRWRPVGRTPRGRKTIEVLHLDGAKRPGILDHYRYHVNHNVRKQVKHFLDALRSADMRQAREQWSRMCRTLLRHSSPYAALSYDAMRMLLSKEKGLPFELPRPPLSV